jgi:hypothetical protein
MQRGRLTWDEARRIVAGATRLPEFLVTSSVVRRITKYKGLSR